MKTFVAYYTSAQNYSVFVFYVFFVMGPKRKKYGSAFNAKKKQNVATRRTARRPFKQHCTRGNSRLSLPVASQQRKLFATER